MKTVITDINMWNATISAKGEIVVTLNGTDKKFTGKLTVEEQEQVAFRVVQLAGGVLDFDPTPQDLVGKHATDMITLEQQSELIVQLNEKALLDKAAFESLSAEFAKFKEEHADVDMALAKLRDEKKHLTLDLHEANGKILALENAAMKPVEPAPKSETVTQ